MLRDGSYREIGRLRNWTVSGSDRHHRHNLSDGLRPDNFAGTAELLRFCNAVVLQHRNQHASPTFTTSRWTHSRQAVMAIQNAEFGNTAGKPETVKLRLALDNRAGSEIAEPLRCLPLLLAST